MREKTGAIFSPSPTCGVFERAKTGGASERKRKQAKKRETNSRNLTVRVQLTHWGRWSLAVGIEIPATTLQHSPAKHRSEDQRQSRKGWDFGSDRCLAMGGGEVTFVFFFSLLFGNLLKKRKGYRFGSDHCLASLFFFLPATFLAFYWSLTKFRGGETGG